jgi:hypothetical protein
MRNLFSSMLLAGAMTMTTAILAQSAAAQTAPPPPERGMLEVSLTYGAMLSNVITSDRFWMQGGSVELEGLLYHGLGAVADIGGMHTGNVNSSGVGLDMVTETFGLRYTWAPVKKKYEFFGQGLGGEANGFHGLFPTSAGATDSSNSMAVEAGGGMNVALSPHVALRAFEVNWLRTQLPNATTNVENNVRVGAGVVLRFR